MQAVFTLSQNKVHWRKCNLSRQGQLPTNPINYLFIISTSRTWLSHALVWMMSCTWGAFQRYLGRRSIWGRKAIHLVFVLGVCTNSGKWSQLILKTFFYLLSALPIMWRNIPPKRRNKHNSKVVLNKCHHDGKKRRTGYGRFMHTAINIYYGRYVYSAIKH